MRSTHHAARDADDRAGHGRRREQPERVRQQPADAADARAGATRRSRSPGRACQTTTKTIGTIASAAPTTPASEQPERRAARTPHRRCSRQGRVGGGAHARPTAGRPVAGSCERSSAVAELLDGQVRRLQRGQRLRHALRRDAGSQRVLVALARRDDLLPRAAHEVGQEALRAPPDARWTSAPLRRRRRRARPGRRRAK